MILINYEGYFQSISYKEDFKAEVDAYAYLEMQHIQVNT